MKKPEKRDVGNNLQNFTITRDDINCGYNQAIDEYETYHNEVIKKLDNEIEKWKMSNQSNINIIDRMEKRWRLRQRGEIK